MNRATKAALLSAFLFPGVGHFFLKKYLSGTVLAATALTGIYLIISRAVARALQITEKIQRGEVQLDVAAITDLVSKQPTGSEAQRLDMAAIILIFVWLIGIVDSYRVGRILEKSLNRKKMDKQI